jgi:hypothetical protein
MLLHTPSPASLFIYSSRVRCLSPLLQGSFPHTAAFTSFPTPGCWVGATTPSFSCRLNCSSVMYCPSPPSALRVPHPLCYVSFLLLLFIIQFGFFSLFPLGGVSLSRGLCWSGPGLSVGVPRAASLTWWSMSSQAVWELASGGGSPLGFSD